MIPKANVPSSGMFMLIVRFDGYKDSFQNDTRRKLLGLPEWINEQGVSLKMDSISFSLIKSVSQGKSRASGAIQIYSYVGLNPEIYKDLHTRLGEFCKELNWWRSWNLLIAQDVNMEE
jgi:hypothetical protein